MPKQMMNFAASVRQRLLNYSRERGISYQLLLTHYAMERFLYRLSVSDKADQFILKGAMLTLTWFGNRARFTRDLDLQGKFESNPEILTIIFKEILNAEFDDGVDFDPDIIDMSPIRALSKFDGYRTRMKADLGGADIRFHVDVGIGDVVDPPPKLISYPSLLDVPQPQLYGVAPETVVAEKIHAMVTHGDENSRMKDYFDVWMMSETINFDSAALAEAIAKVFLEMVLQFQKPLPSL